MDKPPPDLDERPDVTVIVVNYNTAHLLDEMFSALNASRGALRWHVIVVDNGSRDDSVQVLRERFPDAELIENRVNVGFGRANNLALSRARGRYILLLNTDAFVEPDALRKTVTYMDAHLRCGVLGVKLVGLDGSLQPSCRNFPTPWNVFLASTGLKRFFPHARLVDDFTWDHATTRECDWVPGCYYLVRHEVIKAVGLFDPRYFLYFEEVDHCRSVRQAGWSVVFYPFTQAIHLGGESARSEGPLMPHSKQISALQIESELLYFRKQYGLLGLLSSLMLSILGDAIVATKGFILHLDPRPAASAARHTATMLKQLFLTKLAQRASR